MASDTEVGSFLDDIDHLTDEFDNRKALKKKCLCGYRGALEQNPDGWTCPNCGYLLVPVD